MENKIFYCNVWHWGFFRGAENLLTEEEAHAKHNNGELYTVLINSIENPSHVITLRQETQFFSIEFIDCYGRNYLVHHFKKRHDSERYFLSMAIWREYMSLDSQELAEGYTYFFKENSDECYILKEDFINNERYEKKEVCCQKDKIIFFPKFGKYDDILNPNIIS